MRVGVLLVAWLMACCSRAAAVSLPRGPSRVTRQRITATRVAVSGVRGESVAVPQRVVPIPALFSSHRRPRRANTRAFATDVPAGAFQRIGDALPGSSSGALLQCMSSICCLPAGPITHECAAREWTYCNMCRCM